MDRCLGGGLPERRGVGLGACAAFSFFYLFATFRPTQNTPKRRNRRRAVLEPTHSLFRAPTLFFGYYLGLPETRVGALSGATPQRSTGLS